jgi:NADH-quinone oxidoreductase subunit N
VTAAQLAGLAPLAALAIAAVAAMLAAPLARPAVVRGIAATGLVAAAVLVLARTDLPAAPLGALWTDDGIARFGTVLAALSGLAALVFMRSDGVGREAPALIVLAVTGAVTQAGAAHAASLFLGLEITTLSLVALFAFPLTAPALESAYKLLILSGLASATFLLGIGLLHAETGSLAIAAWHGDGAVMALGTVLLLVGLGFKFSLVPFHMWTPDAFEGAPPAAASLAGVASKVAVALVLLRLSTEAPLPQPLWSTGLAGLGAVSILAGNLQALTQTSLWRMLGYSTIAHSGYLAAILAAGGPRAGEAVLFYLGAYAPALIASLAGAALLGRVVTHHELRGLARSRPLEAMALALGLLSLAGLPAAGGFIAKIYLFTTLVEARAWAQLAVTAVGSGLGFYYYARFFTAPFQSRAEVRSVAVPAADRTLLLVCTAAIVVLGVLPQTLAGVAATLLRTAAPG